MEEKLQNYKLLFSIINSKIVTAYANQKISPATAITDAELKKILGDNLLGGIGYWTIEVDFKIQ